MRDDDIAIMRNADEIFTRDFSDQIGWLPKLLPRQSYLSRVQIAP
jgi:hypothetical protein